MPTSSRRPIPPQSTTSARKQRKQQARSLGRARDRSRRTRQAAIALAAALVVAIAAALIIRAATAPPPDAALVLNAPQPSGPAVAWSPDGGRVAAATSTGGAIGIWDAGKGALLHTIARPAGRIGALAWSGDGRYLAAAETPLAKQRGAVPATYLFRLWEVISWTEQTAGMRTLAGPAAGALAFLPGGRRLAAQDSRGLVLLDVPDLGRVRKKANVFRQQEGFPVLSLSPDRRRIALGEEDISAGLGSDRVAILDATTLHTERVLSIQFGFPANLVGAAAWSPDSTQLAIGGLGGQISIYDVRTGKGVRDLDRGLTAVNALGWSRDGIRLAAGGNDELAIYDTRNGSVIQRRQAPGDLSAGTPGFNSVQGLAWSPDGQRLLIGSSNAHTRIWRPDAAKP